MTNTIRTISILFLTVIFQNSASCQDSKIGILFEKSIGLSDKIFKEKESLPFDPQLLKEIELAGLSTEIEIGLEFTANERISFNTGFKFHFWRERTPKMDVFFSSPDDQSSLLSKFVNINNYISVPLRIRYHLGTGENKLFFSLGVLPNFNFANKTKGILISDDNREVSKQTDSTAEFRKVNAMAELGFGFERSLNPKLHFYVYPNFKIQTLEQVFDVPLNRQHFFYGLSLGLRMKS